MKKLFKNNNSSKYSDCLITNVIEFLREYTMINLNKLIILCREIHAFDYVSNTYNKDKTYTYVFKYKFKNNLYLYIQILKHEPYSQIISWEIKCKI
jgi:hypothetical protein